MRALQGCLLFVVLLPAAPGCDRIPDALYSDHPMGLAAQALGDTTFTWRVRETSHFRIHFQPDSYAAEHIDQLVEDAEHAREEGLRVLGERRFAPRIDVFHLKSRDQVKRITGYPVRGWTDPDSRTVLLVRAGAANQGERHEIAHVISHTLWGHSLDWSTTGWMSESLATYVGGPCSGYQIDEIAAYLEREGQLIPLDSLARRFRSYNDLVAYLQAGSFFGFLLDRYGLARVRALWERGIESFEVGIGIPPAEADAQWRKHLRTLYPEPRVNWAPLKAEGCQ